MYRRIIAGATSQLVEFPVYDSSSTTGALLTGLAYNTGSLSAYYSIQNAAGSAVSISLVTMTKGTWASGGFVAVDGTNMPGVYQLGIPNLAIAATAGVKFVTVMLKGAANMVPVVLEIELQQEADMAVNITQIDGYATNGNYATLNLKKLNIVNNTGDAIIASSTGSNGSGLNISGNGSGNGITVDGGATSGHGLSLTGHGIGSGLYAYAGGTGDGIHAETSAGSAGFLAAGNSGGGYGIYAYSRVTGKAGFYAEAQAGNANGIEAQGYGSGDGFQATGGVDGDGIEGWGGSSSGSGIHGYANSSDALSAGITGSGKSTGSTPGIFAQGGSSGCGFYALAGASGGHGIYAYAQYSSCHAVSLITVGVSGHGLYAQGGDGGSGVAIRGNPAGSGNGLDIRGGSSAGHGMYVLGAASGMSGLYLVGHATGRDIYAKEIGAPVAIDGGSASLAGILAKMADDTASGGSAFDATTDSLQKISDAVASGSADPSAIADAVWDEVRSGHTAAGSFGQGVASVQGAVTGAVASVTAAVTVGTNNDKTGYALTTGEEDAIVDKVWDELRSAHTVSGSFGQGAASVQGNVTGNVNGNVGGNVAGSVDSVTDPVTVGTNNDKTGYALTSGEESAIADAVWDEAIAGHTGAGKTGKALNDVNTNVGTPVALDSGTASIAGMLTKMADDNGGADFNATTDSLEKIATSSTPLTAQQIRDSMKLAPTVGVPASGSVDEHLDNIDSDAQSIVAKLPNTGLIAGQTEMLAGFLAVDVDLTTVDGKQDTAQLVLDAIEAKLPTGTISDLTLDTTFDGVRLEDLMEVLLSAANGRFKINQPEAGKITFYKRDSVTSLFVVNVTESERTRV